VRLLGSLGPEPARERATRRLEAFVAAEANRRLGRLRTLKAAVSEGRLKGLARGLAYQLIEAGGAIERSRIDSQIHSLSQAERRDLKRLGVRFGAFSLYLPALLQPEALSFSAAFADLAMPHWRPSPDGLSPLPHPAPSPLALSQRGLRAVAGLSAPIETLERLDALMREGPVRHGGVELTDATLATLGWSREEGVRVLRGLAFTPARGSPKQADALWRRRRSAVAAEAKPAPLPASPFAALATLTPVAPPAPRRKRRRVRKQAS